ncbi:ABC transporter ATP-binding protein [Membranihabitans maritimus]|uniref:ABC transporter ATP-binding protein n=1 Tax=Membranihabitans maritimus TaxID=2904244 RepID=UPI001F1EBAD7|nr:ABC transporter ATP-binding protein [Membranihabitans maritimus]
MKSDWREILTWLKPYSWQLTGNIFSNILVAIFTVVSIPVLKPFFDVLFDQISDKSDIEGPVAFSFNNIEPFINYYLFEFVNNNGKEKALLIVCLFIVANFLLKNIFRYISLVFMAVLRNGIVRDLRNKLFDTLLIKPFSFYKEERKGNLLTIMSSDVMEFESSVLSVLETIIRSPLIIIGSLGYMLYVSPELTLYVLLLMLFTIVVIGGLSRRLKKNSKEAQDLVGSTLSITEEAVYGIKTIRAFYAQDYVKKLFSKFNNSFRRLRNKILFRKDLASPMSEFLGVTVVTVLLWLGSNQVFSEEMDASTFLTFIFAFYNIIDPAKSFSSAYYNLQKGMGAYSRIQSLINSDKEVQLISGTKKMEFLGESIVIERLNFKYPGEESNVLSNINIEIKKGDRVALVGASGSGKTTLVDLICRFLQPTSGTIRFDNIDIKEFTEDSFRKNISIVSQEPVLFHDSIRNNICLNDVDHDEERILSACHKANVSPFLNSFESGLDTIVGEGGGKLSGGQRQRIVLARALYYNAPILVLDEATSALDSESENSIQEAIENLGSDKTIIIIAHRLQTIRNADKIIVLDDGVVIEEGQHSELIDSNGVYRRFVELQSF